MVWAPEARKIQAVELPIRNQNSKEHSLHWSIKNLI